MKIGLMIVGDRGYKVLESLSNKYEIIFVVSYNDEGNSDNSYQMIQDLCNDRGISFNNSKKITDVKYNSVDKLFVIGWQYIIHGDLDKVIVFHDSYLPEFKGWAPTVNYLIEGKCYLGVTAFKPTNKVDTGPIYHRIKKDIEYPIKISNAIKIVSMLYVDIANYILENNLEPIDMVGDESFGLWRDELDYFINWEHHAHEIKRFVDAVGYPYAGAKITVNGEILTVEDAEVIEGKIIDVKSHLGKILRIEDGEPVVVCSSNLIKLKNITDDDGNKYTFKKLKIRL